MFWPKSLMRVHSGSAVRVELKRPLLAARDREIAELQRQAAEADPDVIGRLSDVGDALAEKMATELDAELLRRRGLVDDFLFDRSVAPLTQDERAGRFHFDRPVALFPDIGAFKEAEQILGVEFEVGIARGFARRFIVVRQRRVSYQEQSDQRPWRPGRGHTHADRPRPSRTLPPLGARCARLYFAILR